MSSYKPLLLFALCLLVQADDDAWFQLRHASNTLYPPAITAYVDQPARVHPIRLTWSPPGAARYAEAPALYSALWVDETQRLAEQTHIRLLSRKASFWFAAQNMTHDTDRESYLKLYLAHDSLLYQRWTHAIMTHDMLQLTKRTTVYKAGPRAETWTCDSYDAAHRCVVRNVTLHLVYNNNQRTSDRVVISRVVLDWEVGQSQLPPWIYGALAFGQLPANKATSNRLVGAKLADTWLVRDDDVAIDDTEPLVAAGALNDTLVLGRHVLWRTFNVFAFDARAGEWTLNRVQSGYEALVQLLQVSAIIQAVLLAYHATGMYMLILDKVIRWRGKELRIFAPDALTLLDRCVIIASVLLGVFQLVGAVLATGSGPYTDRDRTTALWRLSWMLIAVGGWQVLWGLIFHAINTRHVVAAQTRSMLHIMGHATYIKLALLGELAALLPDSVQSNYFLVPALVLTGAYVVPSFAYTALSLIMTASAHEHQAGFMWAAGLTELLATLTLDAAAVVYLFRPFLYQHQVLLGTFAVWCLASALGGLALAIPALIVFLQEVRGIMSHEKVKKA